MEEKNEYQYKIHNKGLENLIHGIIKRAVDDYKQAIKDGDKSQQRTLEKFFHSDWYKSMTNVDGDYIISKAKKTTDIKQMGRTRMCKQKIKKKKCDKV